MANSNIGADWTGHAIIDVGLAAICALSGVRKPSELTAAGVEAAVAELEEAYYSGAMTSYLTCLYLNAAPVNPTMGEDKRVLYKQEVLRGYHLQSGAGAAACGFCGRPSVKGANRQHVPLLMAEGCFNFLPAGQGSLPVCGLCLTAAQAFAFGAVRCQGRALAVHSDNPAVTLQFAREAVTWNRQQLLKEPSTGGKYGSVPDPRAYLVETLGKVVDELGSQPASAAVYHLTSSGQGPDLSVYYVPSQLFGFLRRVWLDRYRRAWEALVKLDVDPHRPERVRNRVYEDLFGLPATALAFMGWLTKLAWRHREAWPITELFLKEVLGMDKERIDAIKELADRASDEIAATNDRSSWRQLYFRTGYSDMRNVFVKLDNRAASAGRAIPVGFEHFVAAFVAPDGVAWDDWRLARDLVLIRMIERLAESGFLAGFESEASDELEEAGEVGEALGGPEGTKEVA